MYGRYENIIRWWHKKIHGHDDDDEQSYYHIDHNGNDDDDNNNNNKYTDTIGTFESHGHSSKCSIVHTIEYSIPANVRKK
jgi:hypothetical protein